MKEIPKCRTITGKDIVLIFYSDSLQSPSDTIEQFLT